MSELKPVFPENLGKTILEPINHGLAAAEREALKLGVPVHSVIEMLVNHLGSVVAMIDPPGSRATAVEALVRDFGSIVHQHVEARKTTPGGIRIPDGVSVNG